MVKIFAKKEMSATSTSDNIALLKRLEPAQFYEQFLSEGCYPDGRDIAKHRPTVIHYGGVTGGHQSSAYVQQAGAHVSCAVQLSLAPDSDDALFRWELQAMDSVPKDLVCHAQAHLDNIFAKNLLVDSQSMRVTATSSATGKQFELRWGIQLEIMVLSTDGFLFDAVLTAVQAALLDVQVPTRVEYADGNVVGGVFAEGEQGGFLLGEEVGALFGFKIFSKFPVLLQFDIERLRVVPSEEHDHYRPMELRQCLVYVPFLLYRSNECKDEDERILLCDPSADLCALVSDRCELIVGAEGHIHSLSFCVSSGAMEQSLLDEMLVLAKRRFTAVTNSLRNCASARKE
uniref:Ribosomal RNA-processing protein 43 n=1 Tax=Globodera pallida TaxID=36090 RepID=A0A183BTX1_GLOPA